jgi:hypothetical protein
MSSRRPDGPTRKEVQLKEEIRMTTTTTTLLSAARAEALFTSRLATGSRPTYEVAQTAIRVAVRAHGGVRGCAAEVAAEFGDYPEVAAPRMRWARSVVEQLYEARPASAGRPGHAVALAA